MEVFDILEALAADNSRLAKEAILRQHAGNDMLKETFRLAYDPMISYYIRKIPNYIVGKAEAKVALGWAMQELEQQFATRNKTGNAAIEHLKFILESLDAQDASVIERIIKQDLRCGVGEPTINKIWPGLIKTYPVMLASGFEQKLVDKIGFPAYVQLKLDGMRFNAIVRNGKVEFRSRNGRQLDIASDLFGEAFIRLAKVYGTDIVFDGELLVVDGTGKPLDRKTGNGILTKAIKGTQSAKEGEMVRATLWDAIPYEHFVRSVYTIPYKGRFGLLVSNVEKFKSKNILSHLLDIVPTEVVENQYTANKLFNKYLDEGQEGIILKSMNGIWEDKRSKDQVKFKAELECDLMIVGWEEGTGKNKGRLGALICESNDGLIRVNVGSGYTDEQRKEFVVDYVVGKVATVKYNARIQDKGGNVESLFLPTFIELREDKNIADDSKRIK